MQEYKNKNDLLEEIDWAEGIYNLMFERDMDNIERYSVSDIAKDKWVEAHGLILDLEQIFSEIWAELGSNSEDDE